MPGQKAPLNLPGNAQLLFNLFDFKLVQPGILQGNGCQVGKGYDHLAISLMVEVGL